MLRPFFISLAGSAALVSSAFLPWLRIGEVGLPGIPDPAGYFVLGVGAAGLLLSAAGLVRRAETRPWLTLAGIAGSSALIVVWLIAPTTIADRARARAEAVAIVDNVAVSPVPPVRRGIGLGLGLAGALAITGVGLTGVWSRRSRML